MVLHRPMGQDEPFGDLLVRHPGADHPQYLGLALGEPRYVRSRVAGQTAELAEHEPGKPRGEHGITRTRPADRVEELLSARRLHYVACRARLDRAEHVAVLTAR